ncbi:unnamed protein product [Caenorhabditis angaria]|uniref:Uncharacterized protein n=1 Tax=Caenorhabditis angaria TaxID=860376 RepID=A0A9P1IB70_9PELO|nr:unnamed protein product [Caenorhabditis angaria]
MHKLKFGPNLFTKSEEIKTTVITKDESSPDKSDRKIVWRRTKCSFVKRPIRHIGTVCLCYCDPNDCTTCSARSSIAEELSNRWGYSSIISSPKKLPDNKQFSTKSKSTSSSCSSDGSSLFGDDYSTKNQRNIVKKGDEVSRNSSNSFDSG